MQRLKKIDAAGYRPLWLKPDAPVKDEQLSRFPHSLGVYALLNCYGAPIEEQIAGLIHDISHSAFSHCIDYVLSAGSEKHHDHQDNIFEEYIKKTEIPDIFKKYNLDIGYIIDDSHFPLKETQLPDLCADRIDYILRTLTAFEDGGIAEKNYYLNHLKVKNNIWFFDSFESAMKFARMFMRINNEYYSGFASALMFRAVGDYLKYALEKKYISETNLYSTDKEVLEMISRYHGSDEHLKKLFDRMNKKIGCKNNPDDYEATIFCKSRIVDPYFMDSGQLKRLSDVDSAWKEEIAIQSKPKQYFLKFNR